jgi:DNA polymerase eta
MAQVQPFRTIVHLDLDCFYAQVEMLRVGIPEDVPYVLLQWGKPIAVNYPARSFGVQRFEEFETAIQKCPHLRYSHVPTFAEGDSEWRYHQNPQKDSHKVSLDPYRNASRQIFDVLCSFEGVQVEKGGIDEAFMDVTARAQEIALAKGWLPATAGDIVKFSDEEALLQSRSVTDFTYLIPFRPEALVGVPGAPRPPPEASAEEFALLCGAALATQEIRQRLKERLGYNASAGICVNKMMAKLVSAANKPNKQTLLLPSRIRDYLVDFKFQKLRGFGGKLGNELSEKYNAQTCGEMWSIPLESFVEMFGAEEGKVIWAQIRGVGDSALSERSIAKSILAQKAFAPSATDTERIEKWAGVLCREIVQRSMEFLRDYSLRPHGFNVKLGGRGLSSSGDLLNQTFKMPWPLDDKKLTSIVVKASERVFKTPSATGNGRVAINCILLGAVELRPTEDRVTVCDSDGSMHVVSKQRTLSQMFAEATDRKRKREDEASSPKERPEVKTEPSDAAENQDVINIDDSQVDDNEDNDVVVID